MAKPKLKLGRPLGRGALFTREVLDMIPVWVEMGARPEEIAAIIGSTVGSLQVKCSQERISLAAVRPVMGGGLTSKQWAVLRRESDRRGVAMPYLVAKIIMNVADDNLFAAVLGDYDSEAAEARPCAA